MVLRSTSLTGGTLVYAIDDPYIHMAMARNLALHGVWSVYPEGFTAASSAPGWVVLLSGAFLVSRFAEWTPLALNIIFGAAAVWVVYAVAAGAHPSRRYAALAALLATCSVPLPVMALVGMEHVLHFLLTLLFAWACARALAGDGQWRGRMFFLALALPAVRYEGLFAAAAAAALFLFARRWGDAARIAATAWIVPAAVGIISIGHGGYFFPNPLLMKTGHADPSVSLPPLMKMGGRAIMAAWENPALLGLIAVALVFFAEGLWRRRSISEPGFFFPAFFLIISALHLQLANTGWFYRYEAYLVGMGAVAALVAVGAFLARPHTGPAVKAVVVALVIILAAPMAYRRAADAFHDGPLAARKQYRQQYQMAKFLARYYPGAPLITHDIGAVCWLAESRVFDLAGLASIEMVRAKKGGYVSPSLVYLYAKKRDVKVAVVFEGMFSGRLLTAWSRAGVWRVEPGGYDSDDVSFFAVDAAELPALKAHLAEFAPSLTPSVTLAGM